MTMSVETDAMKNSKTALIAVALVAAALVAGAVLYDATLVTAALGLPVQGGEGAVAVAGLGASLAAAVFGIRELRRARRPRPAHA